MKILVFLLLITSTFAYAQYDKFDKTNVPVSAHTWSLFNQIGYAWQNPSNNLLQLGLLCGTNYRYDMSYNYLESKINALRDNVRLDFSATGIGIGADLGFIKSNFIIAPKLFVEFQTLQHVLFYRITLMDYLSNQPQDMRIMPEVGTIFGKYSHMNIMLGYSQPLAYENADIGRLRVGFNYYPISKRAFKIKKAKDDNNFRANLNKAGSYTEPEMIFVEGGTFQMGNQLIGMPDNKEMTKYITSNNQIQPDEKPVHEVTLSNYFIGKYEVTLKEFRQFIESTGYLTDQERNNKKSKGILYLLGILKMPGNCFWNGMGWQSKNFDWHYDAVGNV